MKMIAMGPLPPPLGGTTVLFSDFCERIKELPVDLIIINTNDSQSGNRKKLSSLASWWVLFRNIKDVDVISLHASSKRLVVYGAFLRIISIFFRVPVIVRGFGGALDIAYARRSIAFGFLYRLCFSNSLVLLETQHLINYFKEIFPRAKIDWLPNSRSMEIEAVPAMSRGRRFVFVGHVNEQKGVGLLVRMLKQHPNSGLSIDLIGACSPGFDKGVLEGVPGLRYLGEISAKDVRNRLGEYRALVLPTKYEGEGYPGVILEAYIAGLPVISTRWRSIPEIVDVGRTGFLVAPDSVQELHDVLMNISSKDFDIERMSDSCIQYSMQFDSAFWHRDKWRDWFKMIGIKAS